MVCDSVNAVFTAFPLLLIIKWNSLNRISLFLMVIPNPTQACVCRSGSAISSYMTQKTIQVIMIIPIHKVGSTPSWVMLKINSD